jgi:RNA polymerase sigma factor (sigma-70 family)
LSELPYHCITNTDLKVPIEKQPKQYSPQELLEGFRNSTSPVMNFIYKENIAAVRKYVRNNNGSDDDVKDIYQEAIIATWLNINDGKYQPKEGSELGGYIFQIARFKWLDKLKSKASKTTMRLLNDEAAHQLADSNNDNEPEEDIAYLQSLYQKLGDKCRSILTRFYYEKKSLEEIGQELQYDASTLRTLKYRCMMQLRKMHLEGSETNKK